MEIKLNLLSEAKKIEVRRKKRYRFIVWQEIILVSLLLFYVGILAGIYYMNRFQLRNLESANVSKEQEQAFREIDSAEKKFQSVNKQVAEMLKFQKEHTKWSNFFIALDEVIPEGVLLEKVSTVDRKISLMGKADTRDALLMFKEKLNASECFQNADIPLSDLFTQDNIDFQLDVEIKKDCLKPGNL
ncbi:MAG: PilN domain-containing protein [Candidatus Moranbacteria bacterium]|nr:PilN domain-containing protein [Candidatus Moranbacteria bacterium]